jgi:hypothetical protein
MLDECHESSMLHQCFTRVKDAAPVPPASFARATNTSLVPPTLLTRATNTPHSCHEYIAQTCSACTLDTRDMLGVHTRLVALTRRIDIDVGETQRHV